MSVILSTQARPALAEAAAKTEQPRHIRLEGSYNTRDLGGYPAAGGKRVRSGLIYRSDDLSHLTATDLLIIEGLGLKTIIDFRGQHERREALNRIAPSVRSERRLAIDAGNMIDLGKLNVENGAEMMEAVNRSLVNGAQRQYREFFELVSRPENLPALFHCSAGKDRTGLAAALLLSALGVEREVIYRDYLASAEYIAPKYAGRVVQNPGQAPLMTVQRSYLEAAFDEIDTRYGGVDNYLRKQLQVDVQALRNIYLK